MLSNKKHPSISVDKSVLKLKKSVRCRKVFQFLLSYLNTTESENYKTTTIIHTFSNAYNIKFDTLKKRFYRRKINTLKSHKSQLLEDRVERGLAFSLATLSSLNIPMHRSDVINYVRILTNKSLDWQGSSWFYGFMSRHSKVISERKVRQVTEARVKYDVVEPVNKFIDRYEQLRMTIADIDEVVINVDESRVSRNSTNSNTKYVVSSSMKNGSFITSSSISTLSVVVFITASGHTLLVVHILPDSTINEKIDDIKIEIDEVRKVRCLRGNIMNTAIAKTKSGWVTTKCWMAIINYFSKIAKLWLNE